MADKIINNGNWFLAEIIEKYEPLDSNKIQVMRRVTTWGNYHLFTLNLLMKPMIKQ